MTLSVRPATAEDIPLMVSIASHAATASHWPARKYAAVFAHEESSRIALLVEENGIAQGFLIARCVAQEWELENIAIAAQAQRRGLGSSLLRAFLDCARSKGGESVFLEVRESNRSARSLYEKWLFTQTGRRKSYYHTPEEDALLYSLSLK